MADAALILGERVEARFGGGPGYHSSVIDAMNDDGTYAVKYVRTPHTWLSLYCYHR